MIRCLSEYRCTLLQDVSNSRLFPKPPALDFRPSIESCPDCGGELKVRKTRTRMVSTLHVGRFRAREVFLICESCGRTHRCKELSARVPPGANFGFDVMVHAGKALFLRHRTETEVVAELAERNIQISPREVSLLGMRFVVYTAIAHQRRAPDITAGRIHMPLGCYLRNPRSLPDDFNRFTFGNRSWQRQSAR